ncbi:MAG: asparagine synthase (glutamine-hydrolyzing), partial [Planctomycetia bacterium]|nr:asparagine synthase (glutamine-hydrolyzing) [Planctomycetia bacterium]
MCGICGAVWTCDCLAVEQKTLDAMTDMLTHRGPDDRGTLLLPLIPHESDSDNMMSHGGVAFGHRRLSIIDLSPLGRQPMCNEDQTVWLTFNGEIYNYRELREMLLARGHRFRSDTDTETIVHLYEEYGEDVPQYLSGMFALAIWDVTRRKLILARDRFGKKPLFYRVENGRLLFASELKSLLTVPGIKRELDLLALDGYLTYQYVPFPRTIYRDISKLPPASLAVWNANGDFTVRRYWSPPTVENKTPLTLGDWQRNLREALTQAVGDRLQSDVPLGAFLSGGIDSTIIVGLMSELCREKVHTFSIGFRQKEYDETEFARHTAKRLGTDHHEFIVTPDAEAILPELVRQYDEPFADSSAIPTWYLSEMTRTQVTVALSGDGGDELFAGYDRYKAVLLGKLLDIVPSWGRSFLAGPVRWSIPASVRQRSFLRRVKRFLEALAMSPMERYLQWIA